MNNKLYKILAATVLLLLTNINTLATAHEALIKLYEGNRVSQDHLCTIVPLSHDYDINFKKDRFGCPNDEARSLILQNIPVGSTITLYDSPSASRSDDYVIINVKKKSREYSLGSFESGSFEDDFVRVTLHYHNGLDGKVSHLRFRLPY